MTKPLLIATAVGSLAIGFGVGYKVAEKRLSAQFEERLQKETAGMREFYEVVKKPFATPQEAAAELIKKEPEEETTAKLANDRVSYHKIVKKEYQAEDNGPEEEILIEFPQGPDAEIKHHNVFDNDPVLISQEEYMANESEYIQGTLTYYEIDKVLTDELENNIEDRDAIVGDKNLEMFGDPKNGSSDPNVIHVRNPRLQMEFEVCLDMGSYTESVLGIEGDLPQLPSGRKR